MTNQKGSLKHGLRLQIIFGRIYKLILLHHKAQNWLLSAFSVTDINKITNLNAANSVNSNIDFPLVPIYPSNLHTLVAWTEWYGYILSVFYWSNLEPLKREEK